MWIRDRTGRGRTRAAEQPPAARGRSAHALTLRAEIPGARNGIGLYPAYAEKLFEVSQRLHAAEEFEGTGIGLASVRRILKRHGGRTWANAAPGAGATFYFSRPRATETGNGPLSSSLREERER